jgi:hypothetical protein
LALKAESLRVVSCETKRYEHEKRLANL